jgi:hypothetical protein
VLRTNTDLNPLEAMLCYKQLCGDPTESPAGNSSNAAQSQTIRAA